MAIITDAAGEYIRRATVLPSPNAVSFCGWARLTNIGDYQSICAIESGLTSAANTNYLALTDVGSLVIWNNVVDGVGTGVGSFPGNNIWFFFGMTSGGGGAGAHIGYMAAIGDAGLSTGNQTGNTFTSGAVFFGNNSYSEYLNGEICALKMWSAVLTAAEIANERWSFFPRRMTNLTYFNPGINASDVARDWTGNADMTIGGTPTTAANPFIGWRGTKSKSLVSGSAVGPSGGGVAGTLGFRGLVVA